MFVKWKYTAREKIGVKVNQFLKIVWKISNLCLYNLQSTKTFLPVVLKYMPYMGLMLS